MRNIELSISFCSFFQLVVFVSENSENKMIFATQFVFYLMVQFVRAANKGKITQGKTPRVFYIFGTLLHYSGSSWSYKCERSLFPCQVSLHSMHSTSVYGLKLSVLRDTGVSRSNRPPHSWSIPRGSTRSLLLTQPYAQPSAVQPAFPALDKSNLKWD